MLVIFGDFELDRLARQLRRGAVIVHLEPKAFELLSLLIDRRPEAISKGHIKDRLWPDTFVSESSLTGLVGQIRQALGDDPKRPRFLRTVHGFGYAFSGEVSERIVDPLPPDENIKTLVVLPFENLGGPEDDYFADGMADEVRGKLAALPALQVIARGSSNEYKNTTKTQRQIAVELGAQYMLTATVRWDKKAGAVNRVRVSPELVQLVEGAVPRTRWQQAFEAVLSDVFEVQANIAEQVARALDVALGEAERQRVVARPTVDLAAYEAYLQGNDATGWFASTSAADLKRAITHYERAVALDAGFALAWAQLSRGCSTLYFNGIPDPSYVERAKVAAERALALDAALPTARLALGGYYSNGLNDWSRALEQYAFGLQAAPCDADLLTACGAAQQRAGRWQESLALLRQAQEFDPRSAATARHLTVALLFLRRYTEAHAAADRAFDLAPRKPNIIEDKAAVFLAQGDLRGARAALAAAPPDVDQIDLVAYMKPRLICRARRADLRPPRGRGRGRAGHLEGPRDRRPDRRAHREGPGVHPQPQDRGRHRRERPLRARGVPPGETEITVTTVGYGVERRTVHRRARRPARWRSASARKPSGGRRTSWSRRRRSSRRTRRRRPPTCWEAPSSRTWPTSSSTTRCARCSPCPGSPPATTSAPPSRRAAWASRTSASTWTAC